MSDSVDPFVANSIRLEVQQPPTGLVNLVRNPNGTGGTWCWEATPGILRRVNDPGGAGDALQADGNGSAASFTFVTPLIMPVSPGEWVASRIQVRAIGSGHTVAYRLQFWGNAGELLKTETTAVVGLNRISARQAPAGTAWVILTLDISWGSTSNRLVTFRELVVATAATSAALNNLPVPPTGGSWLDIAGPAGSITIRRAALEVGNVTAELRDTALVPGAGVLAGGRALRVHAPLTGAWEPLVVGRVEDNPATFDLLDPDSTRRAIVQLSALDPVAELAAAGAPRGAGVVGDLSKPLADGGSGPWLLNGSADQPRHPVATQQPHDAEAKVLDQVLMTRDTRRAQAWVRRDGTLCVYDSAQLDNTLRNTLGEADYGDNIEVRRDLESVINHVTIIRRQQNAATASIAEVPVVTLDDKASVRTHGIRHQDVTVQALSDTACLALARDILAANAQPVTRVISLTIHINGPAKLTRGWAFLDLLDLVRVINTNGNIDQQLRITSIEHDIKPEQWTVTLGFAVPGGTATPMALTPPSKGFANNYTNWTDLPMRSGMTGNDAAGLTVQFKVVDGVLHGRGQVRRTNGSDFPVADTVIGDFPADLPLPFATDRRPTTGAGGAFASVLMDGTSYTLAVRPTAASAFVNTTFSIPL